MSNNNNYQKINLCIFGTLKNSIEINEPIYKLLSNVSDIKILYFYEEIIEINNLGEKMKLSDYFYLILLINDNINIINYIYNLNIIKFLNEYNKNSFLLLQKTIISKMIINLINYYKETDNYSCDYDKELKLIENENKNIIENNINILNQLGIDNNYNFNENKKKIDILFIKIFINLIKNRKFNDYNYIYKIIKELNYDSISITKNMFEELKKELDKKNNYINYYIINTIDDLKNIEKINFYYVLFKYILKNTFFIYYIPFLYEIKKIFIHLIKTTIDIVLLLLNLKEKLIKEKIEYLLKVIPDSEYYYIKHLKFREIQILKEIQLYYKQFLFESKNEEIKKLENILENKNVNENFEEYLKDFEIAKKMNERFPIIIFLYNIENNNDNGTKSEKVINKYVKEWMIIEKIILEKKNKILKENKKASLIKFFSDKNNEKTLLKIFSKDAYDCFIQENIQNLNNNNYKEDLNLKNNNKEKKLEEINKITSNTKTQTNQKKSTDSSSKLLKLIF